MVASFPRMYLGMHAIFPVVTEFYDRPALRERGPRPGLVVVWGRCNEAALLVAGTTPTDFPALVTRES